MKVNMQGSTSLHIKFLFNLRILRVHFLVHFLKVLHWEFACDIKNMVLTNMLVTRMCCPRLNLQWMG